MLSGNLVGLRTFSYRPHITYSWLAIIDAILFFASCYVATWLYFLPQPTSMPDHFAQLPYRAATFAAMTTLAMFSMGLYQPRLREGATGILLRMIGAFVLMTLGVAAIMFFVPDLHLWRGVFVYAAVIAFLASLLTRGIFIETVRLEQFRRRILVLGSGSKATNIARKMRRKNDCHGFHLYGYVRVPGEETAITSGNLISLDRPLSEFVWEKNIDQVVVALDNQRENIPTEELLRCRILGVSVLDILDFFEKEAGKVLVEEASPEWFIFAKGFKRPFAGGVGKRALDIGAGLCLLLASWPVMLLTVIAIKLEDGLDAPVLFRQARVGLHGQVFNVMKFRSMSIDAEGDGKARWATRNDTRITRVGQIIRKLRIDELPQIINVLRGDMAFVGPRPERPEFVCELAKEIPFFDKRHCVKPGITGWAQLNYPYGASITDAKHKLEFDLYYVKNQSLYLDFMVLLQTVEVVVFGKGAH
ncbi:MAG: TIGR03013 family XrtA/PEP-CTERM system glycosyltransferase [Porticoccaceae bacterium]